MPTDEAIEPGRLARRAHGGVVADADDLVDEARVEDLRDEAGADALDAVRTGRPPDRTALSSGSTAIILSAGLRGFST